MNNKIKSFFLALIFQMAIAGLLFIGGLLDPLLGFWVAAIYFLIIGSYLIYHYFLTKIIKKTRGS